MPNYKRGEDKFDNLVGQLSICRLYIAVYRKCDPKGICGIERIGNPPPIPVEMFTFGELTDNLAPVQSMRLFIFSSLLLISASVWSQSEHLARNYMDQGAYEKAESIYKKLYESHKKTSEYFEAYVRSLQEQEKYEEALAILTEFAQNVPNYPGIEIEIGHQYELQQESEKATFHYDKTIDNIKEKPTNLYEIGERFRAYNLLDYAIKVYKMGLTQNKSPSIKIELAKVYGEQGKTEKMLSTFLDLITENELYFYSVNRYLEQYITADQNNPANKQLKTQLLKRLQTAPNLIYNRLLSWLFLKENNFRQAFTQEKAIYKRSDKKNLAKIVAMAGMAADRGEYDTAEKILTYNLEQQSTTDGKIKAQSRLFDIRIKSGKATSYPELEKALKETIKHFEDDKAQPFQLKLQLAYFSAFKLKKEQEGLNILESLLQTPLNKRQEAEAKMIAADILVLRERFNQAIVYYSQVKSLAKHTALAQEALFKVAKTSYYKGDFDWAQTQLKVLKNATSELTANDAIALNILIEENRGHDSTQTALKRLAKSDLLTTQEQYQKALPLLDSIIDNQNSDNITETALFRQAGIYEDIAEYDKAKATYKTIINTYKNSIYIDDALYYLAELYRTKYNDTEKAMAHYKTIIFDHADSIFFVDARKKFRQLRGDDIQ